MQTIHFGVFPVCVIRTAYAQKLIECKITAHRGVYGLGLFISNVHTGLQPIILNNIQNSQ